MMTQGLSSNENMVSIVSLANGEYVGLGAIEILSVPDVSILLKEKQNITEYLEDCQKEMANLLSEIYQYYKSDGENPDIALEILWVTRPVINQPYNANIALYLIVRSIDSSRAILTERLQLLLQICTTTLNLGGYDVSPISYENLSPVIASICDVEITSIVKEERVENLHNPVLPYCYSYDRFPKNNGDLSKLLNVLVAHPNCSVSFQLIPTSFQHHETEEISKTTQFLETLDRGISTGSGSNISYSFTKKEAEIHKYYSENKSHPLFHYTIIICGDKQGVSNISTQLYGQLNTSSTAQFNARFIHVPREIVNKDYNFYPLPWAVNEYLLNTDRHYQVRSGNIFQSYFRLPYIITAEEASQFFRFPVGDGKISAGINVNLSDKSKKSYSENIINSGDITIGKLSSSGGHTIGLSLNDLAKHMLVVGTPGSGKTTFSVGVLDRMWKQHKIPFLVIEPAKNEYRALIQSIPELQVFTPGKNFISPFVFNPFVPPKNVKLETYKSTLRTAFSAAVSMSTPLDKIFEESINNCYSDFRWLDTYTIADKGKIFNISDFIKCFQNTFDDIGYTGDAKNIGRAGVVRLNSLINLFDSYYSIPIEDILEKPTLIELSAIENPDQKALIISLLLLSILAYVNSNYVGDGNLKNLILLEEAHVLLDPDVPLNPGEANPSIIAQNLLKRMLAEIRSYGVGIIIADQSPRKVGLDVIALTDIKLAFRLVEANDRQILAESTNMSELQHSHLGRLKPGEAFVFFNKLDNPEEIMTENYRVDNNISITLTDDMIRSLSHYWDDKQKYLRPYPECAYLTLCSDNCDLYTRLLAKEIVRRIYVNNFKTGNSNFTTIKSVFNSLVSLINDELNDEPFTPRLLSCVECQLLRKIKYDTKIPLHELTIQKTLEGVGKRKC